LINDFVVVELQKLVQTCGIKLGQKRIRAKVRWKGEKMVRIKN
jgi:hypothetical protein